MDIAHFNMVQQQIRPWNIHAQNILNAIIELDRAEFVPAAQVSLTYVDMPIPLGGGMHMLEPKMAAYVLQALDIQSGDRVLVVGAGSGYVAALCGKLGYSVDCVDTSQSVLDRAAACCEAVGMQNIRFSTGLIEAGEYDAILYREAVDTLPVDALQSLSASGRCVAMINDAHASSHIVEVMRYTHDQGKIKAESLMDTVRDISKNHHEFIF